MKKLLISAAVASLAMAGSAHAAGHAVKIGVLLGYTGPIESMTPNMANGAELAMKEISDSKALLSGKVLVPIRADSTCIDAAAANAAAERLITSDGVAAIVGADCSGVTTSVLTNVAVANGIVMISPQMATTKPAPALRRTSRTGTEWPVGAPRTVGSVVNEYWVFAMQTGKLP